MNPESFPGEHPNMYKSLEENLGNSEVLKSSFSIEDIKKSCTGDEDLMFLYSEMMDCCGRYLEDVCKLAQLDVKIKEENSRELAEERAGADEARRLLHDSTMDSIKILVRNMKQRGKDVDWAKKFNANDRSQYASFAIMASFQEIQRFLKEKEKKNGKN